MELPFFIEELNCRVELNPACEFPGAMWWDTTQHVYRIELREYDERVLLHECIHVVLQIEQEGCARLGDAEERLVRFLTRRLYAMGWRLHKTDRDLEQIERELNRASERADSLARELDGAGAPARDWPLAAGE